MPKAPLKRDAPGTRPRGLATPELKPFTKEEAARAFAPDPEWEKVEAAATKHSAKPRKE